MSDSLSAVVGSFDCCGATGDGKMNRVRRLLDQVRAGPGITGSGAGGRSRIAMR